MSTCLDRSFRSVSLAAVIAMTVACSVTDQSTQTTAERYTSVAVLPLEVMTDDAEGVALAESAFEQMLSTLASTDGIRVLGPETTLPYAGSELSSDNLDVILEELGAAAILRADVRGQRPRIAFHFSLHRPSRMDGYLALLTFDPRITMQGSDGEPMTADSMLETELSRLVSTIQTL